ncbi:tail protein X [Bacillaceae bacterium IKA-2]|nr:tail protein X [Bacillaceae bacterium IKA-2]
MEKYQTVSGDTWDFIAYKVYGKEKYANELVSANLNHVETVIFSGGITLNVPELDEESLDLDEDLPPWKRG